MEFDANTHRCIIVIDQQLPAGLAINAASVIDISFGKLRGNLVGADELSADGVNYPGVIVVPLPLLLAEGNYLHGWQQESSTDSKIFGMPFSALAQSCKPKRNMANASPARRANKLSWWRWVWLVRRRSTGCSRI